MEHVECCANLKTASGSKFASSVLRTIRSSPSITVLAALSAVLPYWTVEKSVFAATNDVFAIACPNAVHVADFTTCVRLWEQGQGTIGMVVASSPTIAATAMVRVTGTFKLSCPHGDCSYVDGVYTPLMPDGTVITTDAQLLTTDQTIYGTLRGEKGAPTAPIKLPSEYGGSPIGNEAWSVDANTGINIVVSNAAQLPIGTLVMVVWQDGTTATFVRTNSVPSLLWAYVPGSMKDKNGNPITPVTGVMINNPKSGGSGGGVIIPNSPYPLQFLGGPTCTGTATVTIPDDATYVYTFFLPC
jgi:hypothetical protein